MTVFHEEVSPLVSDEINTIILELNQLAGPAHNAKLLAPVITSRQMDTFLRIFDEWADNHQQVLARRPVIEAAIDKLQPAPGLPSLISNVDAMLSGRRFMIRGTHSPVEEMLNVRSYALRIHTNTTAPGSVSWKDQTILLFRDMSFTMVQFQQFAQALVREASPHLLERLLHVSESRIPAIPWGQTL